jgi:hypothetical protein
VWAYVDSVNYATTWGAVQESDGGNNTRSAVSSAEGGGPPPPPPPPPTSPDFVKRYPKPIVHLRFIKSLTLKYYGACDIMVGGYQCGTLAQFSSQAQLDAESNRTSELECQPV